VFLLFTGSNPKTQNSISCIIFADHKSTQIFLSDQTFSAIFSENRPLNHDWDKMIKETFEDISKKTDEMELENEKLKKERRIAISEVIETLIGKGFIPCNLYAYLTGFLLKEYSAEPYRYSEGVQGDNGGMMSPEKLGSIIGEYYRYIFSGGSKGYKEEFIEIISDEQMAFIHFLENAFNIKTYVVEKAATRLRTYYKNNISFPIWCLKTIMDKDLEEPLDIIAEIMYTESEQTVPSLATKLGTILMNDKNKVDKKKERK